MNVKYMMQCLQYTYGIILFVSVEPDADNNNKVYTDGKHGNYDLTIIILWNNLLNLNFNVRLSDDSKK